jgi:hypothetical protein
LLSIRRQFARAGLFALGAISPFHGNLAALRAVDRYVALLLGLQLASAAGLALAGPFVPTGRLLLLLALVTSTLARWRRYTGGDGAEQMAVVVLAAACLAVLPYPSEARVTLAVLFIAAQLSLSYVTAGIAKLISPVWRDGAALPAILSTHGHGHPAAARFLQDHPALARVGCWTVIGLECLFPLLVLGPAWLAIPALALGLAFHAGCAILMGLNSFLWSFPATYACVLAAAGLLRLWL